MSERGGISIMLAMGALIFATLSLAVADLGAMLAARSRAQAAADSAALAAVVEQAPVLSRGVDPGEAARREAEANGATLVSCDCDIGDPSATVEVVVRPRLNMLIGWRGRDVHAIARADLDPDVLTYRDPG